MNKLNDVSSALAAVYDLRPRDESFADALHAGLSQFPKSIPCKFFYDEPGSQLFNEICLLDEYYVTRTEVGILQNNASEITSMVGPNCHLIEFGSGSSTKVEVLFPKLKGQTIYTAIDISREHLIASTAALAEIYPSIAVNAVCADYTHPLTLPDKLMGSDKFPVVFFPGSSIGNFSPQEAKVFLEGTATLLQQNRGALLIGVDQKKDTDILLAAYNDTKGITAAFNLNLLSRANRELSANFDISSFAHKAIYNEELGRIEMYLISEREQSVEFGNQTYNFKNNEFIHTENSQKYHVDEFRELARGAGFIPCEVWTDEYELFSVHLLRV